MDPTLLALEEAAASVAAHEARRVALILEAHAAGWSLRTIAQAAGLSHQTIANIVRREVDAGRHPAVRQ
jgi:lambda repressor-like predicted transcriptional regulator